MKHDQPPLVAGKVSPTKLKFICAKHVTLCNQCTHAFSKYNHIKSLMHLMVY